MPALTDEMMPVFLKAAEKPAGKCDCGGDVVWSMIMLCFECLKCGRRLTQEKVHAGEDPGHGRELAGGLPLTPGGGQ